MKYFLAAIFTFLALSSVSASPLTAPGLIIPGLNVGAVAGGGLGGSGSLTGAFSVGDATLNGETVGVGEANGLADSKIRIDNHGISGHVELATDARSYSGAAINGPGNAYNISGAGAVAGTGALAGGGSIGF